MWWVYNLQPNFDTMLRSMVYFNEENNKEGEI